MLYIGSLVFSFLRCRIYKLQAHAFPDQSVFMYLSVCVSIFICCVCVYIYCVSVLCMCLSVYFVYMS